MARKARSVSLYIHLLSLFLILLVPVQVFGMGMLSMGARELSQNAMEKSERALESAVNQLSAQIDSVHQRIREFLYDGMSDTHKPLSQQLRQAPESWYIVLRSLMSNLAWIQPTNDAILEVRLFYPTLDFSISGDRYDAGVANARQQELLTQLLGSNQLLNGREGEIDLLVPYPSYQPEKVTIAILARLSAGMLCHYAEEKVFAGHCALFIGETRYCEDAGILSMLEEEGFPKSKRINRNGKWYYLFSARDPIYGFTVANYIEADILDGPSRNQQKLLIIYCTLCVLIIGIYTLFIRRMVNQPMRSLMNAFDRVGTGILDQRIEPCGPGEFRRLIQGFNHMTDHLSKALKTIYDQRVYTQQIEFKQLQAQINPHFLYNTFFTISRMVEDEDNENAKLACRYMGEYFQYITYSDSPVAPLINEYTHATNYLMLQKLRNEDNLIVDAEPVPDRIASMEIPKLIFQPIIENAFKHGLRQANGKMTVRIRFTLEESIQITFENSAASLPEEVLELNLNAPLREGETTALVNIHRRIRLRYGPPYGLTLSRSPLGGLAVTVSLPFPKEAEQ